MRIYQIYPVRKPLGFLNELAESTPKEYHSQPLSCRHLTTPVDARLRGHDTITYLICKG